MLPPSNDQTVALRQEKLAEAQSLLEPLVELWSAAAEWLKAPGWATDIAEGQRIGDIPIYPQFRGHQKWGERVFKLV
jgi:hypothetical protein